MKLNGYQIVSESADVAPALTPEDFQQLRRAQERGAVKGATVGTLGIGAGAALTAALLSKGVPNRETAHKLIKLSGGLGALVGLSFGAAVGTLLNRWKFVGRGYGMKKQIAPNKEVPITKK